MDPIDPGSAWNGRTLLRSALRAARAHVALKIISLGAALALYAFFHRPAAGTPPPPGRAQPCAPGPAAPGAPPATGAAVDPGSPSTPADDRELGPGEDADAVRRAPGTAHGRDRRNGVGP